MIGSRSSERLSCAPGPAAQGGDASAKHRLRFKQSIQVALQLSSSVVARVHSEQPRPPGGPRRDQSIPLQRLERLLDRGEADLQESRQLAGIALGQETQREKHPRACGAPEGAGSIDDLHRDSFDRFMRSVVKCGIGGLRAGGTEARSTARFPRSRTPPTALYSNTCGGGIAKWLRRRSAKYFHLNSAGFEAGPRSSVAARQYEKPREVSPPGASFFGWPTVARNGKPDRSQRRSQRYLLDRPRSSSLMTQGARSG